MERVTDAPKDILRKTHEETEKPALSASSINEEIRRAHEAVLRAEKALAALTPAPILTKQEQEQLKKEEEQRLKREKQEERTNIDAYVKEEFAKARQIRQDAEQLFGDAKEAELKKAVQTEINAAEKETRIKTEIAHDKEGAFENALAQKAIAELNLYKYQKYNNKDADISQKFFNARRLKNNLCDVCEKAKKESHEAFLRALKSQKRLKNLCGQAQGMR